MIRYYLSLLLALAAAGVTAQNTTRTISGTVSSAEDTTPLEGVAITIKGTKNVSGSQPDGIYYIPVTSKDSVLVFSHPSYITVEVKLSGSNEYNVTLHKKEENDYSQLWNEIFFRPVRFQFPVQAHTAYPAIYQQQHYYCNRNNNI